MALAAAKILVESNQKCIRLFVTITPSGSYATDGDTLSLAGLVPGKKAPLFWTISGHAGYVYEFNPGTDISNGLMLVRKATTTSSNNPLGQHSAAAYDALVVADVIRGEFVFRNQGLDVSG
jgi:hypothetical protein